MTEPTIFEMSSPGRRGVKMPVSDVPEVALPKGFERQELKFPEISELEAVRHFTRLSQLNHAIDTGFYPLGSCTMKYNPKSTKRPRVFPVLPTHILCNLKIPYKATSI